MNWKPNKWIAGLLGFLFAPIGMLYVARAKYAFLFIMSVFGLAALFVVFRIQINPNIKLTLSIVMPFIFAIVTFLLAKKICKKRPLYSRWYGIIIVFSLFALPYFIAKVYFFEIFSIPSSSMAPNIVSGNYIVVKKQGCGNHKFFGYPISKTAITKRCSIARGDIIVFENPQDSNVDYLKRVVGIAGDSISYSDNILILNNIIVEHNLKFNGFSEILIEEIIDDESYQIQHMNRGKIPDGKWVVPNGEYFVLGDNRHRSADSKQWGFVPEENIIGKLYYVFN